MMETVVNQIVDAKGPEEGIELILGDQTMEDFFKTMRQPDWALLYFKLRSKTPDTGWQTLLNITHLGRSGVSYT